MNCGDIPANIGLKNTHMLHVWYIYYIWVILRANVGKYSIHGACGIGLIYGRYLQFRILEWPLMMDSHGMGI